MSSAIFRTGLRSTHVVLAGAMVPAGTVLVTPGLEKQGAQVTAAPRVRAKHLSMRDVLYAWPDVHHEC